MRPNSKCVEGIRPGEIQLRNQLERISTFHYKHIHYLWIKMIIIGLGLTELEIPSVFWHISTPFHRKRRAITGGNLETAWKRTHSLENRINFWHYSSPYFRFFRNQLIYGVSFYLSWVGTCSKLRYKIIYLLEYRNLVITHYSSNFEASKELKIISSKLFLTKRL